MMMKKIIKKIKNWIKEEYFADPLLFRMWVVVVILLIVIGVLMFPYAPACMSLLFLGDKKTIGLNSSYSSSKNSNNNGGGGGGSGNAEQDEKENKALDNLFKIANYNSDTLRNKYNQSMNMYDVSDEQLRRQHAAKTRENKMERGAE